MGGLRLRSLDLRADAPAFKARTADAGSSR